MCGIVVYVPNPGSKPPPDIEKEVRLRLERIAHRGPDFQNVHVAPYGAVLGHARLAIVDPSSGAQPIVGAAGDAVAVNAEIYNHVLLRKLLVDDFEFTSRCDCEVLLPACREWGCEVGSALDGQFAFVWVGGVQEGDFVACRDPIGINPLYWARVEGGTWFASEVKAIHDISGAKAFPPGHVMGPKDPAPRRYFEPDWMKNNVVGTVPHYPDRFREIFDAAVKKRLMADVEFGVLLSGGLDSSLVAALAQRESKTHLKSFSIGLEGSPDLVAAKRVAAHIGTEHHEVHFTVEQGLDALERVVRHIETVDTTTIRASTPMLLLAEYIRDHTNVKMVLSGEGADEIFCGYLYFHNAPTPEAAAQESARKVLSLHMFDCQRANHSMMSAGIECRVPFLDAEVVKYGMNLRPEDKIPKKIEKYLIRQAYAGSGLLPEDIMWRQKEQFSDGVGYSWVDGLKAFTAAEAKRHDDDAILTAAFGRAPTCPEQSHHMRLFARLYPGQAARAGADMDTWCPEWNSSPDPSGRAIHNIHVDAYQHK